MTDGVNCPLCGRCEVEPVLDKITVMAEYDDFAGPIGALVVLRCKEEGHIFFVRKADIQVAAA
ncbi:MAG TPA: hypothetical protein VFW31_02260 [Candidatus Angelobacter sp.]|nr:hypothetical protein [Candidatus Angelobacter sp.]